MQGRQGTQCDLHTFKTSIPYLKWQEVEELQKSKDKDVDPETRWPSYNLI